MGQTGAKPGLPTTSGRDRAFRVALVTSSYNYIADGVALTLNRLVAFLESHCVEVLVFAPVARRAAFAHEGTIAPAPSLPFPLRPEYRLTLGLTRALRERLRAFDPDIIHIATPDILGRQALKFAKTLGKPVVASFHTRYETYLEHYGLGFLRGAVARSIGRFYDACQEVYVPSSSMAEVMTAGGGGENVRLWTRGVDTARFDPAKRSEVWRRDRGFAPGDLAVAFVSRLVREKRLATVVETVRRLRGRGVSHRMLFVGDGPEREALEKALPDAVFTGRLDGEELAVAYASADLFLFPSDSETFGSVTLEAMASGLPTLCAAATGSRSLVEAGVTGFLEAPGDAEAFADHIAALSADPALRAKMGVAARARSLRFSWDEANAGLLARYRAVAGR